MKIPYPIQQSHIDALHSAIVKHRAALDTSSTGTGKTLCAIRTASKLGLPVLVVCPKAVIPSWRRELDDQGVQAVQVVNYEKLRTGKTGLGSWNSKKWVWALEGDHLIVWDEVHRCKSPTAQNTKMLIAAKNYHNLMLSATVADDPTELRGVGYVLGLFELQKFWNWCRAHGCSVNPWGAMEFDHKRSKALEKIHEKIMPERGSRMSVQDMAGHFAENFIIDDPLDFSDDGRIQNLYQEMERELDALKNEMADDSTNPAAKALVAQLRGRQAVELCKVPLMVEMIGEIHGEGRSAAVFVNFDATIDAIMGRLQQTEKTVSIIRGGQSETEREISISRFQSGASRTIICNMEAGGVGVSLHDTTGEKPRTALISPNFNAKSLVQVLGRIHRAGGKSPAIQRILVAEGTIEEKVAKSVKEKIKSQDILNGSESVLSNTATGVYYPTNNRVTIEPPMPTDTTSDTIDHSSRDHAEHGPSTLEKFEICPGYRPRGGTNWAADRGTRIHEALEAEDISRLVDPDEQAIAQKCYDYVQSLIESKGGRVLETHKEIRVDIELGGGESTFGTCDLGLMFSETEMVLLDYKTGYGSVQDAEINAQAWAYTIGAFQRFEKIEKIDFFFLLPVRDEVSHATFTRSQLREMQLRLQTIIKRAKDGKIFNPQPGVCDYCSNQASCPALAKKALLIANKYPEAGFPIPQDITGAEASAEDLAALLKLAPIMESWAEGIKKLALSKALEEGWELPGFRLQERKTPRSVTSALQAYEAIKDSVSITDFLAACTKVSVPDLESYFAESIPRGKKGQAKQQLVDRLTDAGCLKQEGTIHVLKAEKN
jgi:superfamily II DNA or RNA helicase